MWIASGHLQRVAERKDRTTTSLARQARDMNCWRMRLSPIMMMRLAAVHSENFSASQGRRLQSYGLNTWFAAPSYSEPVFLQPACALHACMQAGCQHEDAFTRHEDNHSSSQPKLIIEGPGDAGIEQWHACLAYAMIAALSMDFLVVSSRKIC